MLPNLHCYQIYLVGPKTDLGCGQDTCTSSRRGAPILPISLKERRNMVGKSVREDLIRLGFDVLDDQDKQLSLASLAQTGQVGNLEDHRQNLVAQAKTRRLSPNLLHEQSDKSNELGIQD